MIRSTEDEGPHKQSGDFLFPIVFASNRIYHAYIDQSCTTGG